MQPRSRHLSSQWQSCRWLSYCLSCRFSLCDQYSLSGDSCPLLSRTHGPFVFFQKRFRRSSRIPKKLSSRSQTMIVCRMRPGHPLSRRSICGKTNDGRITQVVQDPSRDGAKQTCDPGREMGGQGGEMDGVTSQPQLGKVIAVCGQIVYCFHLSAVKLSLLWQ